MTQPSSPTIQLVSPRMYTSPKFERVPSLQLSTRSYHSPSRDEIAGRLVDHLYQKTAENERASEENRDTPGSKTDRISNFTSVGFKKLVHSSSVKVINFPVFFSKSRRNLPAKNLTEKQLSLIKKIDPLKFEKTQLNLKNKKDKISLINSKKSTFYNLNFKTPLSSTQSTQYGKFGAGPSKPTINLQTENILRKKLEPLSVNRIKPVPFKPTEQQLNLLRQAIQNSKSNDG